jgi:hypothetical protein
VLTKPLTGSQVIAEIRKQTDTILLAFSCGKDAIAAWLELRKHFTRIVPYYMYLVPDLEFVEKSLRYYESVFGCHIYRLPHPSLYRMLNRMLFQAPENCAIIENAGLRAFSYHDAQQALRDDLDLPAECYVASGVRAADSPIRRLSIQQHGAINRKTQQFFPVWDWRKDQLISELRCAKICLPADYRVFGRSFDGVDYRFLAPMKHYFPDDYARVLRWFPLAEVELKRREYAEQH